MKKLLKNVGKERLVVFLDLEGTQFSHELIALGAYKAKLKKDGTFARLDKGFDIYVKAINHIGRFVEKLTGITQETLDQKGVNYDEAMTKFKKYVGRDFKKAKYVTFGNHDIRIFSQSQNNNLTTEVELFEAIKKNHIDLARIISEYIKDDKDNSMSLTNYCKLFNINMSGHAHEALSDARNLALLYNAVIKNPNIVGAEYKKILVAGKGMPRPIQKLMKRIAETGTVTTEDLDRYIKEEIKA